MFENGYYLCDVVVILYDYYCILMKENYYYCIVCYRLCKKIIGKIYNLCFMIIVLNNCIIIVIRFWIFKMCFVFYVKWLCDLEYKIFDFE